jgi:hypothetical protein
LKNPNSYKPAAGELAAQADARYPLALGSLLLRS